MINKISADETDGMRQLDAILALLLGFAQKNPGMTRVLIGDALVNENDRLQTRINQMHDRIEATLRQCLRVAATQNNVSPEHDTNAEANLMLAFVIGRWHQFAKSGFKRLPLDQFDAQKMLLFKFA